MMRLILLSVFSAVLIGACGHTATIRTEPEGAWVTVDGKLLGQSPVEFHEMPGMKTYALEVTKAGYQPVSKTLRQSQIDSTYAIGAGAGAATVAGCGFLAGLFTSMTWSTCLWGGGALGAGALIGSIFTQKHLSDSYSLVLEPASQADAEPNSSAKTGGTASPYSEGFTSDARPTRTFEF